MKRLTWGEFQTKIGLKDWSTLFHTQGETEIDCRWEKSSTKRIMGSRIRETEVLVHALAPGWMETVIR